MKRATLQQALNEIRDDFIQEAVAYKKRRVLPWLGTVAAVIVLFIGMQFLQAPIAIQAEAVALAEVPVFDDMPQLEDYQNPEQYLKDIAQWESEIRMRPLLAQETGEQLQSFSFESIRTFLSGQEENQLYSPANAYLGLAMTAELTGGETHQQLMNLLGAEDLDSLRSQARALWESIFLKNSGEFTYIQSINGNTSGQEGTAYIYVTENREVSIPANSIWLDDDLDYNRRPMTTLAQYYYASVYRQDLSGEQAIKDIQTWLDTNTGNTLGNATSNIQLPEDAQMVLYSTLYFRSSWTDAFDTDENTQGTFYGTTENTAVTFMNKHHYQTFYFFGDTFCAVALELKNGNRMWFLLPAQGKTVDDMLNDPQYLEMVTAPEQWTSRKNVLVNLSVPKFDVQRTTDLRQGLESLGITDLFDPAAADFSPSLYSPAYLGAANQSIRIAIDESGVIAASYVELPAPGASRPPVEVLDFCLNQPFLFLITKDQIPLFAGVINQP